jgi:D-xylose transport system permease protein
MTLERSIGTTPPPRRGFDLNAWAMAGVLVALWTILAILPATRGVFLTRGNFAALLGQNAYMLVIAVGVTLVVVIRGVDLSVGAGVALTGTVAALLQLRCGYSAPIAIAGGLGCGIAVGLWQGFWIARLKVPAFVVTLAGFYTFRGLALVFSEAQGLAPMHDDFSVVTMLVPVGATWAIVGGTAAAAIALVVRDAARRGAHGLPPAPARALGMRIGGYLFVAAALLALFGERGMPMPILVAGAVAIGATFLTHRTRFGRHVYAIGGNPEAARLSGINVERVTLGVYLLVGVLTAVGGVLLAGRINGVTPGTQGDMLELDVITAVVIGGTSMMGGRGSIVGTVLGALVFGTLANGMNLLEIDSNWQLVCKGQLLMLAVLVDVILKGRRS